MQKQINILWPLAAIIITIIITGVINSCVCLSLFVKIINACLALIIVITCSYITYRQLKTSHAKAQAYFEMIVDSSELALWDVNITNNTIHFNKYFARIYGLPFADGSQSMDWLLDQCHEDDKHIFIENYQNLLNSVVQNYHFTYRLRTATGQYIWLQQTGSIVEKDHNQKAIRATGISIDVTLQKESENTKTRYAKELEELVASRTQDKVKLEMIIDGTELAVWDMDLTSSVITFNKYFSKLIGFPIPEGNIKIEHMLNLIHDDDCHFILNIFHDICQGKIAIHSFDYRILHQNGHYIWLHNTGRVIQYDLDDRPARAIGITLSIEEQKTTEQAKAQYAKELEQKVAQRTDELHQERSLLQSILENIPDAIFYQDTHGKYLGCNRAHANMCGINPSKIIGKTIYDITSNTELANYYTKEHDEIIKDRSLVIREDIQTLPNGERIYLETIKTVFTNPQEKVLGILGISRNITQRKHYEAELTRMQKEALLASQAKSSFLANMSHEIRTPMNGIIGLTHLALRCELSLKLKEYLTKIDFSAKNLLIIINEILDFSKIEAGKVDLELANFELATVLNNLKITIEADLTRKNLYLDLHVDPAIPQILCGDALRLGQILLNLTNNAIKFTETGGITITVTIDSENIPTELGKTNLIFSVTDTGIGIDPEYQKHLFESFTQADASITRKYGGTGLGLTITKKLIELMYGHIQVSSIPELGTTFTFNVCFSPALPALSIIEVPSQTTAHLNSSNILLAEDNEINQLIASEILTSHGYTVDIAANGEEAVKMAQENTYMAILMDIQMPILDGLEATKQIRNIPGLENLPIIAMTAHAMSTDSQKSLNAGMNGHITKPINPDTLINTLQALIA